MNEKLKNYAEAPDPEVWERIEKTMRRRAVRRQAWTAAAGVVVVALAVVGVVLWPGSKGDSTTQMARPDVAQVMPSEEVAVEPMLKEPVATEVVAINASTVPPEPAKTEQAVVTEPVALMPATQAEVTAVVSQPSVTTQPMQAIPISKPVSEVVPVVAAAPVETQPSVNTSTVASEPAKSQTKSPTTFGLEDTILWLPNVFMPASDDAEINVFRARLNHPGDVLTNYRMTVFNRSGAQVFATTDINEGWDGKHWGRELPQAAYVYVVYYTDKDGFRHQRKGTVTLVR